MRDKYELLKERVEIYLQDENNPAGTLEKTGIVFEDLSREYGFPNFRFPCEKGYVRAYKSRDMKHFKVQIFRPIKMNYSGVSVFEPSGRRSV